MTTKIEKAILQKMLYEHVIGGKHTSADSIPKGFPKSERGEIKKPSKT